MAFFHPDCTVGSGRPGSRRASDLQSRGRSRVAARGLVPQSRDPTTGRESHPAPKALAAILPPPRGGSERPAGSRPPARAPSGRSPATASRYTAYSSSYRACAAGSGSMRAATTSWTRRRLEVGDGTDAGGGEDRRADDRRLPTDGIPTGSPSTSALIRAQASPGVRRPAGRSSRIGAPASASGSATDRIANAAPSSTARASSARPVAERQPDERAPGVLVEQRRPLAREVRQEHEAAGAGRDRGRLREQRARVDSAARARPRAASRPRRPARPSPRRRPSARAAAPGATNSPSAATGAIGVDPQPAGGAARVDRVAGEPGGPAPSMLAVPSLTPAIDRDARGQAERRGGGRPQLAQPLPEGPRRRHRPTAARPPPPAPPRPTPSRGPAARSPPRPTATGRARPTPPAATPRRSTDARLLAGQPGHRRQQPEAAAAGPAVLPRDRRPHRLARRVDHRQRRALPDPAHRQDLDRRPRRSPGPTPRPPPTSPTGTAPPGRPARRRCG